MTATTRTDLALAACQGLDDEDLKERGTQGFKKMIHRKRMYAQAARVTAQMVFDRDAKIDKLQKQLTELQGKYEALMNLDAPVENTDIANQMLAGIAKKGQV